MPKMHAHSIMHSRPPLPHVFGTPVHFPIHVLTVFFIFPHGWGVDLAMLSGWALSLTFLLFFPHYLSGKTRFLVAQQMVEEKHNFWVLVEAVLPT